MIQVEGDVRAKNGEIFQNKILDEYAVVTESLLRDLEACKGEQTRCRAELETLSRETKRAAEVARESFRRANEDKLTGNDNYQESLENLRKRISILEMEKETVFQMWQMSSRSVDALEEELKSVEKEGGTTKYYEERIHGVKETYSEAIKALESKLLKAKENFTKNQALCEANREKTENLTRERNDLERKLSLLRSESRAREESHERLIGTLKGELESSRNELEKARDEKLGLHEKLREARNVATIAIAKGEESKIKVAEALEIAETAIAEKEAALVRESRATEERLGLESRLNVLVEEYTTRLDRELGAARESFERGGKKCALEMKELKVELREKVTLLDRLEREKRLLEEELERARQGSESVLQRSSVNVLELEEKLKEAYARIETREESCRKRYEEKIRLGDERIEELEGRLAAASDRLRRTQQCGNRELEERCREADDRTKEILERYSALERRLTRTLDEKENVACEMRTLRTDYDREIAKRDNERRSREAEIRELRDHLKIANEALDKSNARCASLTKRIETSQQDFQENERNAMTHGNDTRVNQELMLRLKSLQDRYDRKTEELTRHVETHRKLCRRWKDEAKSLTTKFQLRTKEFREKVSILRKENDELNKELLASRQQLAQCRSQMLNRYDQEDGPR